jgi:hypothetical protein
MLPQTSALLACLGFVQASRAPWCLPHAQPATGRDTPLTAPRWGCFTVLPGGPWEDASRRGPAQRGRPGLVTARAASTASQGKRSVITCGK